MASRSSPLFKPTMSMLAATAPGPRSRPPFSRTSSSSSARSTTSDDSLLASLRTLTPLDLNVEAEVGLSHTRSGSGSGSGIGIGSGGGNVNSTGHPLHQTHIQVSSHPGTPGGKRSRPIAIELPGRELVYTPLSARGDLQGGYFPNHDPVQSSYRNHPFDTHHTLNVPQHIRRPISSPNMSGSTSPCSPLSSPSEATPTARSASYAPSSFHLAPIPSSDTFAIPRGKYYPSNYKKPTSSKNNSPTSSLPNCPRRPSIHQRRPSEVKQKLQQYQRSMIEQARMARETPSRVYAYSYAPPTGRPLSPRLGPAMMLSGGSITPLELESESSGGYILAGMKAGRGSFTNESKEADDVVGRMIRREEDRMRREEGVRSPAARV